MSFVYYDIGFLIIASILGILFLYKRRKNLNREMGIFYLYRTQLGVRFIERFSKKYAKLLSSLKYIIIGAGYILMAFIIYTFAKTAYIYIRFPIVGELFDSPPVFPVVPYFPTLFGVENIFPPFYFTYFLIAFVVVATFHEFAHGIYAKLYKINIKSTGVVFLGPLLAGAFVEQDDKQMEKAKKTDQLAVLAAGVFANTILTILFFLIWWLLFSVTFVPAGATFTTYSNSIVDVGSIESIGGTEINGGLIDAIDDAETELTIQDGEEINLAKLRANGTDYYFQADSLKQQLEMEAEQVIVYNNFPAINQEVKGTIIGINDNRIRTYNDLAEVMPQFSPGDEIKLTTDYQGEVLEYDIVLAEDPDVEGRAVIGIGNDMFSSMQIEERFAFFRSPFTKYDYESDILYFIYYMVFWIFLLNLAVAIFNMLPLLIFDGGRFFYLTIWGITKSEKAARKAYKWMGILILASILLLLATWVFRKYLLG
jgi:membrane-associated protease RseP (regulator of RpoE activity)